jgi:hypothetical protein
MVYASPAQTNSLINLAIAACFSIFVFPEADIAALIRPTPSMLAVLSVAVGFSQRAQTSTSMMTFPRALPTRFD